METLTLTDTRISRSEASGKPIVVKKLIGKFNESTNAVAIISSKEIEAKARLKKIAEELKEKNKKLLEEQKDLRQELKTLDKKKLFMLGTVATYQKELKELGLKVKEVDVNLLLPPNGKE